MSRLEVIRPRKPSVWSRIGETIRSYTIGPLSLNDPEINKYFSGGQTSTGVSVSEFTALNYSAVWSAVNLISGDVASLPLVLYRRNGRGKERYEAHPLYRLLHDAPNPEMSSVTFRRTLQAHALTWGNGYAEIERDTVGRPKYVWPITPDRVEPFRDDKTKQLLYRVSNENAKQTIISPTDMIHVPGLGWDGVQGYGAIAKARESVALGLAAEKFGGTFYGNGSTFGGVIRHPTRFATLDSRNNFEKSLRNRHKGVERAHGLLLLEEGMEYAQIGIPPDQAQFLESRQFQITEIARWFNVPPHKIGDLSRATFSNIEQQNIEYFQTTLIHWLETWEQELMRKLISPLERNQQFIEHVVEGLLRGDSQGRAALELAEFQIGGLMPNEGRALSNRDPVEGGDRAFVPLNMIPLDRVDEWIDAQIEGKKNKGKTPPPSQGRSIEDIAPLVAKVEELTTKVAEADGARRNAETLAEDRAQAREEAARLLEEARAELAQTLELYAGLQVALAEEQSERALERTQIEATVERLTAVIAERDAALAQRSAEHAAAVADLQAMTEQRDLAAAALAAEQAERARERSGLEIERDMKASLLVSAEGHVRQVTGERDEALDVAESRAAEMVTLSALVNQRTGERDEAMAALQAQNADYEERFTQLRDATTTAQEARTVAETQASDATHARDEARDALYAEQAAHARTTQERDAHAAAVAQAQAELQQTRENHAQRVNGILVAHRALIADVMGRVVAREIERARKHAANPQKFRAWIDTFYGEKGVEDVAEALVPAVRAHLSILSNQCDPHEMARQLAEEHVAESAKQLRDLLHVDEFVPMLERTLAHWEASRPEDVADRLLTKGLADVR